MPHLKRLMETGAFTDTVPTLPPWTPPGWATVATGAWPSTHGIEGFGIHFEGEPLTQETDGFISTLRKAQTFWESAETQGKRAILFKYPGIWPHRSRTAIQVGGLAGYAGRKSDLGQAKGARPAGGCLPDHLLFDGIPVSGPDGGGAPGGPPGRVNGAAPTWGQSATALHRFSPVEGQG